MIADPTSTTDSNDSTGTNPIDILFNALSRGDAEAARATLASDATVWHGFDRIAHDRDGIFDQWQELIATFPERKVADIQRLQTPKGFVQQHLWVVRTPSGGLLAWPVCLVATVRDGQITDLHEYLDRAGHFVPDENTMKTPELR